MTLSDRIVRNTLTLGITGTSLGLVGAASAATISWDGGTVGTGSVLEAPANWAGDVVPAAGDAIFIATATVSTSNTSGVVTSFGTLGSLYLNNSATGSGSNGGTTPFTGTPATKTFTSLTFGSESTATTKLPATLQFLNGFNSTYQANNNLTFTGDSANTMIAVGAGVTSPSVLISSGSYGVMTLTLSGAAGSVIRVANAAVTLQDNVVTSGTAGITKTGDGVFYLSSTANSFTGNTNINAGTLRIANGGSLGSTANITSIGDATLQLDNGAAVAATRVVNVTTATSKVTVAAASSVGTFNNGIGGTGALNKVGLGTVITTLADTYTGVTNVTAGTFRENGTHALADSYTVSTGATYGGAGVISLLPTAAITATGTISPGAAAATVGTLTVNGNVALTDGTTGGTLAIDFVGGTNDQLTVVGALNVAGASLFAVNVPGFQPIGTAFVVASYTTESGAFGYVSADGYVVDYNYNGGNQIALVSVPEPTTLALLGLGSVAMLRRRSRA